MKTRQPKRKQKGSRWILLAVALFILIYAVHGPLLYFFGEQSTAIIESVNRESRGHVNDRPNDYYWNVSYRFNTSSGDMHKGFTRVIGASYKVDGYSKGQLMKVYYWSAAPRYNTLETNAEPGLGTLVLLGLSALLFFFARKPRIATKRKKAIPRNSKARKDDPQTPATASTLDAEATRAWVIRYCKHGRWYAWGFYVVIVGIVLGIVSWEMGGITDEVIYSVGFFAMVTLMLAVWSRSRTSRSWQGIVTRKWIKEVKIRYQDRPTEIRYQPHLEVKTDRYGVKQLPLSEALFTHIHEDDALIKIAGFDFPEKVNLPLDGTRVCICCGALVEVDHSNCTRCRAPVPDHSTLLELSQYP